MYRNRVNILVMDIRSAQSAAVMFKKTSKNGETNK